MRAEVLVAEAYPGAVAHTVLVVRPDGHWSRPWAAYARRSSTRARTRCGVGGPGAVRMRRVRVPVQRDRVGLEAVPGSRPVRPARGLIRVLDRSHIRRRGRGRIRTHGRDRFRTRGRSRTRHRTRSRTRKRTRNRTGNRPRTGVRRAARPAGRAPPTGRSRRRAGRRRGAHRAACRGTYRRACPRRRYGRPAVDPAGSPVLDSGT